MGPAILAFGFVAPLLLAGLALAAAPVVIHLLFRRRHRETRWAAMQFLTAAVRKQRRWMRLEELLLLAVRTAIPLLAAVALAGPVWDLPPLRRTTVPLQRVLLLDASLSTTALVDGQSGWDRARQAAIALVESSQPGDVWQVVRLDGKPPYAVISEPTARVAPIVEELRSQTPGESRADIAAGLRTARSMFDGTPDHYRKEAVFLTDAQQTNWRPADDAERDRIRTALKALAEKARVVWWESGAPAGNTAVTDLQIADSYIFTNGPIQASATLQRFGVDTAADRKLEWLVNGRLAASQPVDVVAGTEVTQSFRYTPTQPGDVRIEVRLPADDLPGDDRRAIVVPVRDAVRVLLVDGRPSGVPFENGTDLLRLALSPTDSSGEAPRRILPTVISDGEILSLDLTQYDVVFLCDVPLLTERDAKVIRQYVAQGGSVVVCAGPQMRTQSYNQFAFAQGDDWLPARLGEVVGDARRRDRAFAFAGGDLEHPILSPFRGNPNTGFELTQTYAYLKCQPAGDRATVVLRFDTGDPAILEAPFHRGRVVLVTTSVDRSWGTWAVWGHSFVPMMHETVRHVLSFRARERNGLVGDPLVVSAGDITAVSLVVRRPHEQTVRVGVNALGNSAGWEYADTLQAGFYGVEASGETGGTIWFARNIDPNESHPAPVTPTELREDLLGGAEVSFDFSTERDAAGVESHEPGTSASAAGRWLLGLVLLLLLAEPFLAWNRLIGLSVVLGLTIAVAAGLLAGTKAAAVVVVVELAIVATWGYRQRQVRMPGGKLG